MQSTSNSCQNLMTLEFFGQKDRLKDMTKLIFTFRIFAEVPKIMYLLLVTSITANSLCLKNDKF
jgi:hypothetical protein